MRSIVTLTASAGEPGNPGSVGAHGGAAARRPAAGRHARHPRPHDRRGDRPDHQLADHQPRRPGRPDLARGDVDVRGLGLRCAGRDAAEPPRPPTPRRRSRRAEPAAHHRPTPTPQPAPTRHGRTPAPATAAVATPSPTPAPVATARPRRPPKPKATAKPAAAQVTTDLLGAERARSATAAAGPARGHAGYRGGRVAWSRSAGASATFTFTGSSVTLGRPEGSDARHRAGHPGRSSRRPSQHVALDVPRADRAVQAHLPRPAGTRSRSRCSRHRATRSSPSTGSSSGR